MNNTEPLNSIYEIKLALIHLADNYKSIGEKERAYELLKDLVYQPEDSISLELLREAYLKQRDEWEKFRHLINDTV